MASMMNVSLQMLFKGNYFDQNATQNQSKLLNHLGGVI